MKRPHIASQKRVAKRARASPARFGPSPLPPTKYAIGEKIARFTLYAQDENEIVTGGDDQHLDFRVSVQKLNDGGTHKVVLTTVVTTHNFFGKLYLFFILPFHRFGVKTLLSNAVTAKRL